MKPCAARSRVVFLYAVLFVACAGCDRISKDQASDAGVNSGMATGPDRAQDKSGPASTASTGIPGYGASGSSGGNGGASASGSGEPIWSSGTPAESSSRSAAGAAIDDSVISTKVKTALLGEPDIKGTDINVEARNGEVLLSGFVKSRAQIDKAVQVARNVEGVKAVNNRMVLKQ